MVPIELAHDGAVYPGLDSRIEQGLVSPDQVPSLAVVDELLEFRRRHRPLASKDVGGDIVDGFHASECRAEVGPLARLMTQPGGTLLELDGG